MSGTKQSHVLRLHCYLQVAAMGAGMDVLDIATGEGEGALLLARAARTVTGLTNGPASPAPLFQGKNISYVGVADGTIPAAAGSFDLVTAFAPAGTPSLTLSLVTDIRRVLRSSGILVTCSLDGLGSGRDDAAAGQSLPGTAPADADRLLRQLFPHVATREFKVTQSSVQADEVEGTGEAGRGDAGNPHWDRTNTQVAVSCRLFLASGEPLSDEVCRSLVVSLTTERDAAEFIAVRRAMAVHAMRRASLADTTKTVVDLNASADQLRIRNAELLMDVKRVKHDMARQADGLTARLTRAQRAIHQLREEQDRQAARHDQASADHAAASAQAEQHLAGLAQQLADTEAGLAERTVQHAEAEARHHASAAAEAAATEQLVRMQAAIRHAEAELLRQKTMRLSVETRLDTMRREQAAEQGRRAIRSALTERFLAWNQTPLISTSFTARRGIGKARRLARKRNWIAAERQYRNVLAISPRLFRVWVQYGHTLKQQSDMQAAVGAYQQALTLEPFDTDALLHLGHAQKALGHMGDAVESWSRALLQHPGRFDIWEDLRSAGTDPAVFLWTMLEAGKLGTRATAAVPRFLFNPARRTARKAARLGRWSEAAVAYRTAVANDPSNARIWVQYGHALKESGQIGPAQAAYFEALALDPANREPIRFLINKPAHALAAPTDDAGLGVSEELAKDLKSSGEFGLLPAGDLQVLGERLFLSSGSDPRFDLTVANGRFPRGPTLLTIDLARADRALRPLVYVWSGTAFDIVTLPYLDGGQTTTVALRLPDYVTFLRFDPTDEQGVTFSIGRIAFQECSSWTEALSRQGSVPLLALAPSPKGAPPSAAQQPVTDSKASFRAALAAGLKAFLATGATLRLPSSLRPQLSIVLILYNQAELTFACLNSIVQCVGATDLRAEVVILDNGSSDATPELLSRLEGAIVIRSTENLHFLRGVNKAVESATGQYLLLLNNDAQLLPGSLEAAIRTIEAEPDIGAVGGRIILPDGTLQEAGSIIWNDGTCSGYARGRAPTDPEVMFTRDVDFCSGAFLLTPRSLFKTLGLDERYAPAYYEEVDYCVRLWRAGLRVVYDPAVTILHYEFGSAGGDGLVLQARNHAIFRERHEPWLATRQACTPDAVLVARTTASNRKRVLVVEDRVPHDRFGSGYPRSRLLVQELAAETDVTVFPMFPFAETWSDIRQTMPPNVEVMYGQSSDTLQAFLTARRGYYDGIIVCRPHNMEAFSKVIDADPSLLDGVVLVYDAEALFSAREIRKQVTEGHPLSASAQAKLIKAEVGLTARANALVSVSPGEVRQFRQHTRLPIFKLGHAFKTEPSETPFEDRSDILFIGALHEEDSPNVDSLRWFAEEVLPLLRKTLGTRLRVKVVGSVRAQSIIDRDGLDFDLAGPVEDLTECFARARLMIAPTRYSAGIPLKVGQAAAFGVPVVATSLLVDQLGWAAGKEILSADTPSRFAQACSDLYTDPALWTRTRDAALDRCKEDFSPEAFHATVQELIALMPQRRPIVPPLLTPPRDYASWVRTYDALKQTDRREILARIDAMEDRPLISVIVPLYNTPEPWLRRCIESVIDQLYPNWELCLADDASTDPKVAEICRAYAARDTRIRFKRRSSNGHISVASNTALEMATGTFVALLDHDDELADHALYMVAEALERQPDLDVIYSDEDKIDVHGNRYEPWCKPDWSYDLMLSQNALVHLCVYRRSLLLEIGGFRTGFEGSQDYDVSLRMTEKARPGAICHIPHILYHWRAIPGSVALSTDQKDYPYRAGEKAIQEHLDRRDSGAKVMRERHDGYYRVQWPLPDPAPTVAIIIPTKDKVELLRTAVTSILEKTDYPNYQIVIIDNRSEKADTKAYFKSLPRHGNIRVLPYDKPYSYAALNNWAVTKVEAPLLAFLNNDIEVVSDNWLTEMVRHAVRPEVGAVGAKLYYPDMTIQHAGVVVGIGGQAGHPHVGYERGHPGYFGRAVVTQNFSAVTAACLLMRHEVFEELGGFDEAKFAIAFNDVDLGLRVNKAGYSVVWTPHAELMHHESASLGGSSTPEREKQFQEERRNLRERWPGELVSDPFYNPNLTITGGDWSVSFPPRARKPWRPEQPQPHS